MRWFSDLRRANKAADFAMKAAQAGGTFETACAPSQVLDWLKATRVQVAQETASALMVHPIFTDGKIGPETITAEVSTGSRLPTRVRLGVQLNAKPGTMNLNALGSIAKLMEQVSAADPKWQPV